MGAPFEDAGFIAAVEAAATIAARKALAAEVSDRVQAAEMLQFAASQAAIAPQRSAHAAQLARRLPRGGDDDVLPASLQWEGQAWIRRENYAAAWRRMRRVRAPNMQHLMQHAQCLIGLGQFDEASARIAEMRATSDAAPGPAAGFVAIAEASLEYARGHFNESLAALDVALAGSWPPGTESAIQMNRASVLVAVGRFDDAERALQRADTLAQATDGDRARQAVRFQRALLDLEAGLLGPALRQLEELAPKLVDAEPGRHAYCLLRTAELYLQVHMPVHAEHLAHEAVVAFQRLSRPLSEANARFFRGTARREQGELASARDDLRAAYAAYTKFGYAQWEAISLLRLGQIEHDLGHHERAARHAEDASRVLGAFGLDERKGHADLLRAQILHDHGAKDEARALLQEILAASAADAAPWLHCAVHRRLAQWSPGRPEGALDHLLHAADLVERHRHVVPPDECMAAFLEEKAGVFIDAVRWTLHVGGEDKARRVFDLVERSRSRALLDRLDPRPPPTRAAALRRQTEAMRARLPAVGAVEHIGHSHGRREALRRQERALESEAGTGPSSGGGASPASFEAVRTALGPRDVLYEWFRMDDSLLRIRVTQEAIDVRVHSFALEAFEHVMGRLGLHVNRPSLLEPELAALAGRLTADADAALDDVGAMLFEDEDPSRWERVIVVPSGVLHQVPFAAVRVQGRAVIDSACVTTAPSASIFVRCHGVGAPVDASPLLVGAADAAAPEMAAEVEALSRRLEGAHVLSGSAATRTRLSEALAGTSVVHIAAHARYDHEDPFRSGFELSDGWFTLRDLDGLQMAPELVTLAGCATGRVQVTGSDEVFGLARGVLAAGARSLLATLWPVGDASTRVFMEAFYECFDRTRDASQAHRDATRAVRTAYEHPFFWAPFVLLGAGDRAKSP